MFSGEGYASTETGLLVASSTDGVNFRNISESMEPIYRHEGGLRDPMILFWQGEWYMVYSYGGDIAQLLFIAKSSDLLHWTLVGELRVAADTENVVNFYVDVPQWVVDPEGNVHIIACVDTNHHWVEIHPLSADPDTWGDQKNWSAISILTDDKGDLIIQGNTFVIQQNGTYYMAFNDVVGANAYYLRTSSSLTTGWSDAVELNIDSSVNGGDSENLVFLADGTLRFYISCGNFRKHVMWYVDSSDLGVTWTSPTVLQFEGFAPPGINWAQVVRVADRRSADARVSENEMMCEWGEGERRPENRMTGGPEN